MRVCILPLAFALTATSLLAACSSAGNEASSGATSTAATSSGVGPSATSSGEATTTSSVASTSGSGSASSSGSTGGESGVGGSATSSANATSGATTSSTSAGSTSSSGTVAMTDPALVVNPTNGPVLAAPKVQLIAYAEDTFLPDVESFLTELTKTQTWSQQTAEYGVGPLTILPTISIAGTPPKTLDDDTGNVTPFEMTLAQNLSGSKPAWGAADPSTIYLFVLPQGTQVSSGGLCCDPNSGYFGYHYEAPVGSSSVAYAVVCNCANFVQAPLTALDDLTTTVDHELTEAATNPFVSSMPAFQQEDDPHAIWAIGTSGGEVADMCQDNADANYTPPGSTYMIQRSWSNAAAKAGTNPCVPVPAGGPYFNAYPTLPDMVTLNGSWWSSPVTTEGVKIPIGQSKTIDVVLHGDGTTSGPWTVSVTDLSYYAGDTNNPVTQVSLDKTSGNEGDVLHLTIKVLSSDSLIGGEGFMLTSTLGTQQNVWFGAIGQ